MHGISGGRKRVNIASDVDRTSGALFGRTHIGSRCDLHIRGASPFEPWRTLANNHHDHPPALAEANHIMDNLILLAKGGHLVYYGPTQESVVLSAESVAVK